MVQLVFFCCHEKIGDNGNWWGLVGEELLAICLQSTDLFQWGTCTLAILDEDIYMGVSDSVGLSKSPRKMLGI